MRKRSVGGVLFCRIAYVILLVIFIIESALPPSVSFDHTLPIANLFTRVKMRPDIIADDGRSIDRHTLIFDEERGVGEVLRLVPSGAERLESVVCETDGIIEIKEYTTDTQGVFYLARAKGVGKTKLTLTGVSGEVKKTRTITVSTVSGEIPRGEDFSGFSLPTDLLYVGQTVSVGLTGGEVTPDEYGTVIFTSSDESILKVTSWSYERAEATLTATGEGRVRIRARRLSGNELLFEREVTVLGADTEIDLAVENAYGGEIPTSLAYDSEKGLGECVSVRLLGDTEAQIGVSGEAIRIDETQDGFRAVAVGVGSAKITVSSGRLSQTLTLDITVTDGNFASCASLSLSSGRIRAGDLFTVECEGGLPFDLIYEGEGLEIKETAGGAVKVKALTVGEHLLVAKNPSHGVVLAERRVFVEEAPMRVEFLGVYAVVRKSVGHLAFCMALGFLFHLGFSSITHKKYLYACLSNALLISVVTELIQLTVGRKCAVLDMLINLLGFTLGITLALGIIYLANYLMKRGIKNDTGK